MATTARTRGERCLLAHAGVTGAGLAAVLVAGLVHVCLVPHAAPRALPERRAGSRALAACAGEAWAGARRACGTVRVRARWSLAPARCVAAREHPALAALLPHWSLRHPHGERCGVSRGVLHPQYEPRSQTAALGLFRHDAAAPPGSRAPPCSLPTELVAEEELRGTKDVTSTLWRNGTQRACGCAVWARGACARLVRAAAGRAPAHEACVWCAACGARADGGVWVRGRLAGQLAWGARPPLLQLLAPHAAWLRAVTAH